VRYLAIDIRVYYQGSARGGSRCRNFSEGRLAVAQPVLTRASLLFIVSRQVPESRSRLTERGERVEEVVSLSTGAVAEAVGYQSEAAFQRAFKSHMGVTPAQWRKMQEPSGQDIFARPAAPADANPAKVIEADAVDERRPAKGGDAPSLAER